MTRRRSSSARRLLLLTSGFAPVIGGAETYAETIASGFGARGYDVLVVTDAVEGTVENTVEGTVASSEGYRIVRLSAYRGLLDDPSKLRWEQLYFGLLPELAQVIRDWPADVVFANGLETTMLGRMVAEELSVPLVAAYHEHAPEQEPFGRGRLRTAYGLLRPDLVLAGSRFYQERALRFARPERVRRIHHGVDTDAFHPSVDGSIMRKRYQVGTDELLVVNAGRLKPRKGQLELVRAVALLATGSPATGSPARLVIAGSVSSGSIEYENQLAAAVADSGLQNQVVIDTTVRHEEMPALLAAADLVVQPSHEEGLGLAVLEAMSSGRPVVTCPVPGVQEILTSPGLALLSPPGEPGPIAAALGSGLADPTLRASLGARGREHVLRHFSKEVMIDRTEAAVAELLAVR
jgi:glycosyltransferase involved in cell wall biosynthesis